MVLEAEKLKIQGLSSGESLLAVSSRRLVESKEFEKEREGA